MRQNKWRPVGLTLALALGLGVTGYAQAQEAEGCKGYHFTSFLDVRLQDPDGNVVVQIGVGASGNGDTDATLNFVSALGGVWNSANDDFDAEQACIGLDGGVQRDYQLGPPAPGAFVTCPDVVFPGGNAFAQVPFFEDFGRGDILITEFDPNDPDDQGQDFFHLAACQLTVDSGLPNSTGSATSQADAVPFAVTTSTPTLAFVGDFTGSAEAIISQNADGNVQATSAISVEISRESDGATLNCDTSAIDSDAVADEPGETVQNPISETEVECNAAGFGVNSDQFEPDDTYTLTANISAETSCNCRGIGDGVHKWYFGKQASVRPADEPLMQPAGVVTLNDQFASRDVSVRFIRGLWNPAGKNELVDPARDDHHTCYEIATLPGQGLQIFDVDIETNNFGEDSFTLGLPKQLCISAAKTFNGVTEGSPVGTDYLCYTANSDAGGEFTLNDQFDDEVVNVTRLSRFCTPVGKNQPAPPTDPAEFDHLACYDFNEPVLDPFITVGVDDQFTIAQGFDPLTFWAEKPERFCEPARKIAVTPRF